MRLSSPAAAAESQEPATGTDPVCLPPSGTSIRARWSRAARAVVLAAGAVVVLTAPQAALATAAPSPYVYVSDDSGPIQQFGTSGSGALSPLTVTVTPGGGRGIAMSPDGKNLYASGGNVMSQYGIGSDGLLTALDPASAPALNPEGGGADIGSVIVSPDGRSVYGASLPNGVGGGDVVQFDRASDGTLTPKSPSALFLPGEGQTLAMTPDGRFLYATTDNNQIAQFTVSAFDGALTANGAAGAPGYFTGLVASPDSKTLWGTNYDGGTVAQWTIGSDGKLTAKTPATVTAGSSPFGIAVTPDGKSVYVANSGDQTVSQYDVASDGSLTPKSTATVAVGMTPLGVAVSADGANVYVANTSSGTVSQFSVNSDGSLTAKSPAAVTSGTHPRNIALQPPPAPPDTSPPDTQVISGPADGGVTNDNTPTLAFQSSEPASTFTCQIDGGPEFACSSPYTTEPLLDGAHTFSVAATDASSNTDATPAQRTFTVDTQPPQTQITAGPTDGATITSLSPSFSFSSSENGSSFSCSLDGGLPFSCNSPAVIGPLVPGSHSFAVTATDPAGNPDPTPATRSFTLAAPPATISAPPAPAAPTATPGDAQATAAWVAPAADGGAPITSYTVTASPGGQTCSWTSGPLQCTVTGLSNGTAYTFTVHATNSAGSGPESPFSAPVTPLAGPPSNAQLAAILRQQLLPKGKAGRISAVLRRGLVNLPVSVPSAGKLTIQWFLVPAGAHLSQSHPILLATGQTVFAQPGSRAVQVRLTKLGKRRLKPARRLKLTARASFVAAGQSAVTATRTFTLRR